MWFFFIWCGRNIVVAWCELRQEECFGSQCLFPFLFNLRLTGPLCKDFAIASVMGKISVHRKLTWYWAASTESRSALGFSDHYCFLGWSVYRNAFGYSISFGFGSVDRLLYIWSFFLWFDNKGDMGTLPPKIIRLWLCSGDFCSVLRSSSSLTSVSRRAFSASSVLT